ncbi:collagenase [Paraclostridium bifermentans]|uniref:Collagenase n=1 Tax=Paraclostridium bifermentans TaxID=1490 RepID=A0ABY8R6K7_PARBF|nr:collagenase [Paraclostridium bifermentans]
MFAGSTRDNDVLPRKSQVSGLATDPAERFSTDKLLHSKYGSWDFYYYGFAFCDYMYNNRLDIFNNLVDNIISNNVSGYDSYIETLSKSTKVDQGYQTHMQNLVDKYDSLTVPLVSDDYLDTHDAIDLNKISSDIKNTVPLKNVNIVREKASF